MLDSDLAKLYGVKTKRLNEQVKRNRDRFPEDFMFELTEQEKNKVVANCDHLSRIRFSPSLPFAFTEHGAISKLDIFKRGAVEWGYLAGHNSKTKKSYSRRSGVP